MSPKKQKPKKTKIIHTWGPSLLKPLLNRRGISQAKLARALAEIDRQRNGSNLSTEEIADHDLAFERKVNKWAAGAVEHPRGPIMADMCRILEVEPGYFEISSNKTAAEINFFPSAETRTRRREFAPIAPIAISPSSIPIRGRSMGGKEGALIFSPGDVVGMVDAPAEVATVPDVYAVYVIGNSMAPVYRPGHVLIVNPYLPPNAHDDVVIQISKDDGATIEGYVKRFMSMDEKFLKVCQFNPEQTLRFPRSQVVAIHTVVWQKRR